MIFGLERDEGDDDSATTLNYKKCDKPTVNYNVEGEEAEGAAGGV